MFTFFRYMLPIILICVVITISSCTSNDREESRENTQQNADKDTMDVSTENSSFFKTEYYNGLLYEELSGETVVFYSQNNGERVKFHELFPEVELMIVNDHRDTLTSIVIASESGRTGVAISPEYFEKVALFYNGEPEPGFGYTIDKNHIQSSYLRLVGNNIDLSEEIVLMMVPISDLEGRKNRLIEDEKRDIPINPNPGITTPTKLTGMGCQNDKNMYELHFNDPDVFENVSNRAFDARCVHFNLENPTAENKIKINYTSNEFNKSPHILVPIKDNDLRITFERKVNKLSFRVIAYSGDTLEATDSEIETSEGYSTTFSRRTTTSVGDRIHLGYLNDWEGSTFVIRRSRHPDADTSNITHIAIEDIIAEGPNNNPVDAIEPVVTECNETASPYHLYFDNINRNFDDLNTTEIGSKLTHDCYTINMLSDQPIIHIGKYHNLAEGKKFGEPKSTYVDHLGFWVNDKGVEISFPFLLRYLRMDSYNSPILADEGKLKVDIDATVVSELDYIPGATLQIVLDKQEAFQKIKLYSDGNPIFLSLEWLYFIRN